MKQKKFEKGNAYNWTVEEVQDVITRYIDKEESLTIISQQYGVSYASIRRLLLKNNIVLRPNGGQIIYNVNSNYFDKIDTEDKAYWLGFIAADGYISGGALCIKLAHKDKGHLIKFTKNIFCEHPVMDYEYRNGYKYSMLRINRAELVKSLAQHDIVPKKTFILKPPVIDNNLMRHYWRGFFDGDGYIKRYNTGQWGVVLVGVNQKMLGAFREFTSNVSDTTATVRTRNNGVSSFKVTGNQVTPPLVCELYGDSTVYLDRKHAEYLRMCEELNI